MFQPSHSIIVVAAHYGMAVVHCLLHHHWYHPVKMNQPVVLIIAGATRLIVMAVRLWIKLIFIVVVIASVIIMVACSSYIRYLLIVLVVVSAIVIK